MTSVFKALTAGVFLAAMAAPVFAQDAPVDPATLSCDGIAALDPAALATLADAVKASAPEDAALAAISGEDLSALIVKGCGDNPGVMVTDAVHAALQDQ